MSNHLVRSAWAAAVLACGAIASTASAAVSFSFAADVPDVTLAPGQSVPVSIYLVETVTGGDASVLAAENGLLFAQVTASRAEASGATIDSFTLNPAFDPGEAFVATTPGSAPYTAVDASQGVSSSATSGVTGTSVGGVTRVLLLSLDVRAGAAEGVTTFNLFDNPQLTETITYGTDGFDGSVLDPLIASGTFVVRTAVPEPATLAAVAMAGLVLGRRRR